MSARLHGRAPAAALLASACPLLSAMLSAMLLLALPRPARADGPEADETPIESMRKARAWFEYGDYASAAKLLSRLIEQGKFEAADLRGEAFRLLGLSHFYLGHNKDAGRAFLEMLLLNPDAELDPFYVPPPAVAFFEQVKHDAEPQLAPLRRARLAEEEARKKRAVAEAQARERLDEEDEQRRQQQQSAPQNAVVEKRVVQREFWVSLLPFGMGQIQNGDRTLGIALATSETIAGATSAGSALLIESLRDGSTGTFNASVYPLARRLNVAKWVGAGLFYALWIGGAIQASVRYQPETPLDDRAAAPRPAPRPLDSAPDTSPRTEAPTRLSDSPLRLPADRLPPPRMPAGMELTGAAPP